MVWRIKLFPKRVVYRFNSSIQSFAEFGSPFVQNGVINEVFNRFGLLYLNPPSRIVGTHKVVTSVGFQPKRVFVMNAYFPQRFIQKLHNIRRAIALFKGFNVSFLYLVYHINAKNPCNRKSPKLQIVV